MINTKNTVAILFGVSEFEEKHLENAPAIKENVSKLNELLKSPDILGLKEENILVCGAKHRPKDILNSIKTFLGKANQSKFPVNRLIFYFAGHGFKDEDDNFYFSTYSADDRGSLASTTLAWEGKKKGNEGLKYLFEKNFGISERLYIIDACHSGTMSLGDEEEELEDFDQKVTEDGSALIAAAKAKGKSFFVLGDTYTHFSGSFIEILEKGITTHQKPELSIDAIAQDLDTKVRKKDSRFQIQPKNTGKIGTTCFFKNKGYDTDIDKLESIHRTLRSIEEKHINQKEYEEAEELLEELKEGRRVSKLKNPTPILEEINQKLEDCKFLPRCEVYFEAMYQNKTQSELTALNKKITDKESQYQKLLTEKNKIKADLTTKTEDLRKAALELLDTEEYDKVLNQKTKLEEQIKSLETTLNLRDRSILDLKTLLKERKTKLEVFGREILNLKKQIQNLKNPPKPKIQTQNSNIFTQKLKNTTFDMLKVEGGTFQMGGNEYEDEQPIHPVSLETFYMAKYPVTQKLWQEVMGTNPSHFKGDNLPVENVSWEDAQDFVKELSAMTDKKYHLPSEAQWEYAARGGKKSKNYKYSGSNSVTKVAWCGENSDGKTQDVGTLAPNELGIYDMSGNVWEWCQDKWHDDYKNAPKDGSAWESGDSSIRLCRGGSWNNSTSSCRVAYRSNRGPSYRPLDLGFRTALIL